MVYIAITVKSRKRKRRKYVKIGQKVVKMSLFTNVKIVYFRDREFTKRLLGLVSKLN